MAIGNDELFRMSVDITKAALQVPTKKTADITERSADVLKFFNEIYEGLQTANKSAR